MGQYSKFPKLQIEDLGTEGTGDRIGLLDSDGKVVGYMLSANLGDGYVPLSGTEVGNPITGDIELSSNKYIKLTTNGYFDIQGFSITSDNSSGNYFGVFESEASDELNAGMFKDENNYSSITSNGSLVLNRFGSNDVLHSDDNGLQFYTENLGSRGIISTTFFDKKNDPKTFAQLGDVGVKLFTKYTTVNNTALITDVINESIPANSLVNIGDTIEGYFIFNATGTSPKIDYEIKLGGVSIGTFTQVGYVLNNSDKINIKMVKTDATTLKVFCSISSAAFLDFYYENTSFDFTTAKTLQLTMYNPTANEISFKFGELILKK